MAVSSDLASHRLLWVLSTAVELRVPLKLAFPRVRTEEINLPLPGWLTEPECQSTLRKLVSKGLIEVKEHGSGTVLGDKETGKRIKDLAVENLFYGLSARGGEKWEELARPNWSRYVSHSATLAEVHVACLNFERLGAHLGWLPIANGYDVVWETACSELRAVHDLTYWKQLPSVHCFHAEIRPAEKISRAGWPDWYHYWHEEFYRWYSSADETVHWHARLQNIV